jgi:eukaryotic-like serine/threonine-protein kinase
VDDVPGGIGQRIGGRYELVELIGRGGMGCVWRAQHLTLGTLVAIKLLTPSSSNPAEAQARFLREAKAAAGLKSRHVVQILDHGVDGELPYIAMEYLEGETLKARLRREGRLNPSFTATVMRGVLRGVARAHRAGVVHRDLKPDNIFLVQEGDDVHEPVVKVLDFGIAKLVEERKTEDDVSTRTGAMLGTPYYMSPEQSRGLRDLDARSDLWSIAVIAFECLTGKRPFQSEVLGNLIMMICSDPVPVPSVVGPVPPGFDAWFARATQRDRAARFQDAQELATALAEVLSPGERWFEGREDGRVTSETGFPAVRLSNAPVAAARFSSSPAAEPTSTYGTTATSASRSLRPDETSERGSTVRNVLAGVALSLVAGGGALGWLASGADRDLDETAPAVSTPSNPPPTVAPPEPTVAPSAALLSAAAHSAAAPSASGSASAPSSAVGPAAKPRVKRPSPTATASPVTKPPTDFGI